MDGDGVAVRVEDDDLEERSITVRSDEQEPIAFGDGSQGVTSGVANVLVGDPVPASTVRDLHCWQVTLSLGQVSRYLVTLEPVSQGQASVFGAGPGVGGAGPVPVEHGP